MKKQLFPMLIASTLLSACASTMNKEECTTADWQVLGLENGKAGFSTEKFGTLQEQCSEHGISVNTDLYDEGYNAGLSHYCTPYGGLIGGESGKPYQNVCTDEQLKTFIPPYNEARYHFQKKINAQHARSNLEDAIRSIDRNSKQIAYDKKRISDISDAKKRQKAIDAVNRDVATNNRLRENLRDNDLRIKALDAEREFNKVDYEYQIYRAEFIKNNPPPE